MQSLGLESFAALQDPLSNESVMLHLRLLPDLTEKESKPFTLCHTLSPIRLSQERN